MKHDHKNKYANIKLKHAKNSSNVKACKTRSFRDSYQYMNYTLNPQNMVFVPSNLLDSGASNVCPSSPCASTTKAPNLSRRVRTRTYIKYKRWGFWYPFSFGSMRVS